MFDENQIVTYRFRGKEVTKKASEIPRGSHALLDVVCDFCGKTIKRSWSTQLRAREHNSLDACCNCKGILGAEKLRFSIDKVRSIFEQEGCHLLSKEYKNCDSRLEYIARCGHKNTTTLYDFKIGCSRICTNCQNIKNGKARALSEEDVRQYFEDNGCHIIECNYKNNRSKIRYIATCGHEHITDFTHFQQGKGLLCTDCLNKGVHNANWQGGLSKLNSHLRNLLSDWTREQLKKVNYTCEITGLHGDLNVHHMYSFTNIRDLTLKQLDLPVHQTIGEYTDDELQLLSKTFLENNEILSHPVVMLKVVHNAFHSFCGGSTHDTTPEQLEEFISKYKESHSIAS